jgi:hypothetical protein
MKGRSIDKLVYEQLFPKPKASEPQGFQSFLTRYLIPEVRQETLAFYGDLNTQEAKYPGLDYNHPTHRIRLCRWPWHRRLFSALDALGLTKGEVAQLTKWEGTRWAKEKYEREQGIFIRDTTADDIPTWDEKENQELTWAGGRRPADVAAADELEDDDLAIKDDDEEEDETNAHDDDETMIRNDHRAGDNEEDDDKDDDNEDAVDDDSDDDFESIAVDLNRRLRAGAARREAGDASAVLDEEWEQWLKNAVESGILSEDMTERSFRRLFEPTTTSIVPAGLIPVGMVSAARAGRWADIPEFLHPLLRRTLESETIEAATGDHRQPQGPPRIGGATWNGRRTYSSLRLPGTNTGPAAASTRPSQRTATQAQAHPLQLR